MDRDFKGVWIPKEIWLNDELTLLEKCIFVEIDSLDNDNHCTASNKYLAEFCGCSESKVTKSIATLQQLGMIEIDGFDGRHRVIRVVKSTRQGSKKYEADSQKVRPNNIYNNTNNKTLSKNKVQNSRKELFETVSTKKQSLYSKCMALINDFTEDAILQDYLKQFFKVCSENAREAGQPFYTNTFKGKLNKLKSLSDDNYVQRKIVMQTLDNGWNSFYELKDEQRSSRKKVSSDMGYEVKRGDKSKLRRAIEDDTAEKF